MFGQMQWLFPLQPVAPKSETSQTKSPLVPGCRPVTSEPSLLVLPLLPVAGNAPETRYRNS